jgi:hypothetical protein
VVDNSEISYELLESESSESQLSSAIVVTLNVDVLSPIVRTPDVISSYSSLDWIAICTLSPFLTEASVQTSAPFTNNVHSSTDANTVVHELNPATVILFDFISESRSTSYSLSRLKLSTLVSAIPVYKNVILP